MKLSITIIIISILLGAIILLSNKKTYQNINNVSIVNGIQIIEIEAKGGYNPQNTIAKANIPTILKVKTNNTFDCSLSLKIPSLNISTILDNSGQKEIDLKTPKKGLLNGTCSMGMYSFKINFVD